eukprot:Pgem_evm1s3230
MITKTLSRNSNFEPILKKKKINGWIENRNFVRYGFSLIPADLPEYNNNAADLPEYNNNENDNKEAISEFEFRADSDEEKNQWMDWFIDIFASLP